jgi:hypothetical protein
MMPVMTLPETSASRKWRPLYRLFDGLKAEFVGGAVNRAAFDTAAG